MNPELRLTLSGMIAIPLRRGFQPEQSHPPTEALALGTVMIDGKERVHRPYLAVDYDNVVNLIAVSTGKSATLTRPATSYVTPEGRLRFLIPVERCRISFFDTPPPAGLSLGACSDKTDQSMPWVGSPDWSDLGWVTNIEWEAKVGTIKAAAETGVTTRLRLDRGTLEALNSPSKAQANTVWKFKEREQAISHGFLLRYLLPNPWLDLRLEFDDQEPLRLRLRRDKGVIAISLSSLCGWDGAPETGLDLDTYGPLLGNSPGRPQGRANDETISNNMSQCPAILFPADFPA